MIRNVVVILALFACGRASPPPVLGNKSVHDDVDSLVARADAAVEAASILDYTLPLSTTRRSPIHDARELYGKACFRGHAPACWKWLAIETDRHIDPDDQYIDELARHCEKGNLLACRAIAYRPELPRHLFGAAGRDIACTDRESSCDRALLQKECEAGIATSCDYLSKLLGEDQYADTKPPWRQRTDRVSGEGCALGISNECSLGSSDRAHVISRLVLACRYEWIACANAAEFLELKGKILEARDLMERACQRSGEPATCAKLGWRYRTGRFPEPVPGRGHALSARMCQHFHRSSGPKYLCAGYPTPEEDD